MSLKLFTIASSIFVLIFPLIYLRGLKTPSYENAAVILPFYYGISFIVLNWLLSSIIPDKRTRYLVSGAVLGFILSLIGHCVYNIPDQLFNIKDLVHLIAPILYAFIFGVIVYYVDENI
jgi:peptidoglycan/LPS O-acetylase OafA/YrhL